MVVLHRLDDAAGHGLHVAAGHAAVGVQALVDDHQVAGLFVEFRVVDGQPAADVDQGVLLAAHRAAVGVGADFLKDFRDVLLSVARLALLDEIGVFDGAGSVENDANAVLLRQCADVAEVGHRDRLAARHVHGGRQAE